MPRPRAVLLALLCAGPLTAQEQEPEAGGAAGPRLGDDVRQESSSFWDKFIDADDGHFDLGAAVGDGFGFLPVPIFITDPAVGVGGGLALAYIHPREAPAEGADPVPPSISGVAAAATSNGTWAGGAFHQGYYWDDRLRYFGAVATGSLNLAFYGIGSTTPGGGQGLDFTAEAFATAHELKAAVGDSDFYLGVGYGFLNVNNVFDLSGILPALDPLELDSQLSGVSLVSSFDNRDTNFSPTRGVAAEARATVFESWLGSDYDFRRYGANVKTYWKAHERTILAFRGDLQINDGRAPFYAVPFIFMRGIPALRYQGDAVAVVEFELRYLVTDRWRAVGFTGLGWAADEVSELDNVPRRGMYGVGMRYLMARKLGLEAGLDLAQGPEDTTLYITIGTAW